MVLATACLEPRRKESASSLKPLLAFGARQFVVRVSVSSGWLLGSRPLISYIPTSDNEHYVNLEKAADLLNYLPYLLRLHLELGNTLG